MKRPKIGVLPLYDAKKESRWSTIWMFPGYLKGLVAVGGMPFVLPLLSEEKDIRDLVEDFDGFLFTGGQDIDPILYGQEMAPTCNEISPERDYMENILFDEARKQNKSLLGICRGLQLFNVVLGGTLYQDIETQQKNQEPAQHFQKTSFTVPVHSIDVMEGSKLHQILGKKSIRVNSMHHQSIADLSSQLEVSAYAKDGIIEAIEIPDMNFGLAVQWHPEFLWSERDYERNIFKAFVDAAKVNG